MKNLKTYTEYIQENFPAIPPTPPTNKEVDYDISYLGDERKEVNPDFISNQEYNIQIANGLSSEEQQMKKDMELKAMEEFKTLKNIDDIELKAKVEIDRFDTFTPKQ